MRTGNDIKMYTSIVGWWLNLRIKEENEQAIKIINLLIAKRYNVVPRQAKQYLYLEKGTFGCNILYIYLYVKPFC